MTTNGKEVDKAAELIREASTVAFFTGAGVSAESGIPTFRDAQTGIWAKFNPEDLATPEAFERNPKLVWQWYDHRRQLLAAIKPNPGHKTIVSFEQPKRYVPVITQNVDGLHRVAGSKLVLELHGSLTTFTCFDNGHKQPAIELGLTEPPRCQCGSLVRPAVVWFGETLPEDTFNDALKWIRRSEVVCVVGTSSLVQPAASIPFLALEHNIPVIEVNAEPTPFSDHATISLRGKSGEVLPKILEKVRASSS